MDFMLGSIPTMRCASLFLAAILCCIQSNTWSADAYPQRAVRLIVPYPPGGAGDIVGRMLAVRYTEALGQQVVVDNRGGGGQIIATELTAKAPPDGHTLFLASATHSINPGLRRGKLPYDSIKDFTPITLVAESPLVFIANPSLGVGSIKELVAAAKARPGAINYASSGPGTGGHLSVELLKHYTRVDLVHVPYKGAGPALVDLVAGQVQVMCTSPLPAMPHVKAGRLKALGMTSRNRSRAAPDVPTVAEQIGTDYESSLWYAMLAPARTPQPVIRRVHAETVKILKLPDLSAQLLAQGAEPVGNSPQELAKFIAEEIRRWTTVIEQANIRVD
jgi:tripartite-type tricarboxylate transporter receptor subunit TctC